MSGSSWASLEVLTQALNVLGREVIASSRGACLGAVVPEELLRELLAFALVRVARRAGAPREFFVPSPCPSLPTKRFTSRVLCEADQFLDLLDAAPAALAGTYEQLLACELTVDCGAGAFRLTVARATSARKVTGAYYTPAALVRVLLDHTLDPVVAEALALRPDDPAETLLSLTLVDPACGAGNILLAAAQRLAAHWIRVAPSTDADDALRAVLMRCVHGVDRDPMAVALCRFALWRTAGSPTSLITPLTRRVLCGDALLGVPKDFLTEGVPDVAWKTLPGDDREVATHLRARNRRERREFPVRARPVTLPRARALADLWCAAFAWPRRRGSLVSAAPTHGVWCRAWDGRALPTLTRRTVRSLVERHRFLHWHLAFPEVFARGGFDLVLGNPPFLNAIEGSLRTPLLHLQRRLFPELGGTADVAYRMLALADRIRRRGGRVGMVQPRAMLNAPPMAWWRRERSPGGVSHLLVLDDPSLFSGAQVLVALVVLADVPTCHVARTASLSSVVWRPCTVDTDNWWTVVIDGGRAERPGTALCERFVVTASMTAREAYALVPFVVEQAEGQGLKLVTTGLIDPDTLLWGTRRCRYLGRVYAHPRVVVGATLPPSLARRIAAARRPKVLVAGLSTRLEAFLDTTGECVGAVSTYTVWHPEDDVDALRALLKQLHGPEAQAYFRAELGAHAMAGGNVTLRRSWLRGVRVQ